MSRFHQNATYDKTGLVSRLAVGGVVEPALGGAAGPKFGLHTHAPPTPSAVTFFDASTRRSPTTTTAFCPSDYPPDFLRRGHASCNYLP